MVYHDAAIRNVMERLKLPAINTLAEQAGIQTVYRILVYYADGRAYHSAATLLYKARYRNPKMETAYLGFFDNQVIEHEIASKTYQKFTKMLQQAHFDSLHFPTERLLHSATIWCIERATGTFAHQVILTPHYNEKPYSLIINAIDSYLPQAVREIRY